MKIIELFADPSFDSFIVDPVWGPRFWGTIFAVDITFNHINNNICILVWNSIPTVNTKINKPIEIFISIWSIVLSLPVHRDYYNLLVFPHSSA